MAKASRIVKNHARNVAIFKAQHDPDVVVPNAIKAALEKMAKDYGPEHYEYESDFIKLCGGVGSTAFAAHRDAFSEHIVDAKPVGKGNSRQTRRVWFATVKAAKAARGA